MALAFPFMLQAGRVGLTSSPALGGQSRRTQPDTGESCSLLPLECDARQHRPLLRCEDRPRNSPGRAAQERNGQLGDFRSRPPSLSPPPRLTHAHTQVRPPGPSTCPEQGRREPQVWGRKLGQGYSLRHSWGRVFPGWAPPSPPRRGCGVSAASPLEQVRPPRAHVSGPRTGQTATRGFPLLGSEADSQTVPGRRGQAKAGGVWARQTQSQHRRQGPSSSLGHAVTSVPSAPAGHP